MPFSTATPPSSDLTEIIVFGPGYGESILLHLPFFGWVVVDSCQVKHGSAPIVLPLEYLKKIGVEKIQFLILTHPHGDHFDGMDLLIDHFLGRIGVVCRYAGEGLKEFAQYLTKIAITKSAKEPPISMILKKIDEAKKCGANSLKLSARTLLLDKSTPSENDGNEVKLEILSLSPSDNSQVKYQNKFKQALSKITIGEKTGEEIKETNENNIAVALLFTVNNIKFILGSDVIIEEWEEILKYEHQKKLECDVIKVPHHGSKNAFYDKAWIEFKGKKSKLISLCTPFRFMIPKEDDIERISVYSKKVGLTSKTQLIKEGNPKKIYRVAFPKASTKLKKWKMREEISSNEFGWLKLSFDLEGNLIKEEAHFPAFWRVHNN